MIKTPEFNMTEKDLRMEAETLGRLSIDKSIFPEHEIAWIKSAVFPTLKHMVEQSGIPFDLSKSVLKVEKSLGKVKFWMEYKD